MLLLLILVCVCVLHAYLNVEWRFVVVVAVVFVFVMLLVFICAAALSLALRVQIRRYSAMQATLSEMLTQCEEASSRTEDVQALPLLPGGFLQTQFVPPLVPLCDPLCRRWVVLE